VTKNTRFSWVPAFRALAEAVLDYEARQPELIQILAQLKEEGVPITGLQDRLGGGELAPLEVIDPFTLFASFNRGITDQHRLRIIAKLCERMGLEVDQPADFDGVPVVNNQSTWFYSWKYERGEDDIRTLWALARAAVTGDVNAIAPDLFQKALEVKLVGMAKLTVGLYWLNPEAFLPCDKNTLAALPSLGVQGEPKDYAAYRDALRTVRLSDRRSFPEISYWAYMRNPEPRTRYWAGGFGRQSRLKEFIEGSFWSVNYKQDDPRKSGKRVWGLLGEIRIGDRLAIKGFGGKNDLSVHFVGEVTGIDMDAPRIDLMRLDVPLYKGKAPKGRGAGQWFNTLLEVKRPQDIDLVFGGLTPAPQPTAPGENRILYGPPGTGKTYALRGRFMGGFEDEKGGHDAVNIDEELAGTLTWFQAAALALHDLGEPTGVQELRHHPLVQAHYSQRGVRTPVNAFLWNTLQAHTVDESETVNYKQRTAPQIVDKRPDGRWEFVREIPDDLLALAEDVLPKRDPVQPIRQRRHVFVTFHQSYSYEDFVEGIRPGVTGSDEEGERLVYRRVNGVFKRACIAAIRQAGFDGTLHEFCELSPEERATKLANAPGYAVFIDEINRGNIAQILGELITLLEADKRLGAENELIVTLPYSQERFGVPRNLHVIGTMNTADRSVEALDTALRRRFQFQECPPDPSVVDVDVEGVSIARMLATMNTRLQRLYDRDHLIGHAYFIPLKREGTIPRLREIFVRQVLPLLQEYFYDDWGKIGLVLGNAFIEQEAAAEGAFAPFDHDAEDLFAERVNYRLRDPDGWDADAFRSIYEHG